VARVIWSGWNEGGSLLVMGLSLLAGGVEVFSAEGGELAVSGSVMVCRSVGDAGLVYEVYRVGSAIGSTQCDSRVELSWTRCR